MDDSIKTPYFLIRENLLKENYEQFRKALDGIWPRSVIAYSVKTNALPWILKWMKDRGVYAEVVSDEEYRLAQMCGFAEEQIVFNGPVKSKAYLDHAIRSGSIVNIDSKNELESIQADIPALKGMIGIRVNPDPDLFKREDIGYVEDGFRFGFAEATGELEQALKQICGIYPNAGTGLHMHVNSVTRSPEVYRSAARYAAEIIRKYQLTPAYIDMGGGFFGGVPGRTTPDEYIRTIRDELKEAADPEKTTLIIEPGSAMIGSAVELHTTVTDIKDTAHSRIVTTDGSRIHIDPLWLKKQYLFETDAKKPPIARQIVCGYTCMDHDRIMTIENKPELSIGDHIVYHRVGNYTVTFGGPFIRPNPPVYAEINGRTELVRKQMSMEEYYRTETVQK